MTGDRLLFQVVLRRDDPYEAQLHQALKLLPRGYARVMFMRFFRGVIPPGTPLREMRERLEDLVVTAPSVLDMKQESVDSNRQEENTPTSNATAVDAVAPQQALLKGDPLAY